MKINLIFRPVADAFAKYQDVTSGKMTSSYGLKVNGKIFCHVRKNHDKLEELLDGVCERDGSNLQSCGWKATSMEL